MNRSGGWSGSWYARRLQSGLADVWSGDGSRTYFIYLDLVEGSLRVDEPAVVAARECADTRQRVSLRAQPPNDFLCPPSHLCSLSRPYAPSLTVAPSLVSLATFFAWMGRLSSGFAFSVEFSLLYYYFTFAWALFGFEWVFKEDSEVSLRIYFTKVFQKMFSF